MIAEKLTRYENAFPTWQRRWMLLAVWVLLSIPIFLIGVLPSVDFPNHLSRAYLLAHWNQLSGYSTFYQPRWAILPNLALDLVIVPLAKVFPIFIAGQIFIALSIGLTVYGGARLTKAVGGYWSFWCLAPALLVYNRIFTYGFFNFLVGIGLMMWALAIHIDRRNLTKWHRLWPGVLFCLAMFASHLVALALYAVCAGGYDFGRDVTLRKPRKRFLLDGCVLGGHLVLPFILLFAGSPTAGEATTMDFRDFWPKIKLLDSVFQTGQGKWDMAFTFAVGIVVLAFWISKQIRFEKRMFWPVLFVGFVFLVAPYGFQEAFNVDTRLPLVLGLVFIASFVPTSRRASLYAGTALCALLAARIATTSVNYISMRGNIAQAQADLRLIPSGSLLFQTRSVDARAFDSDGWDPPVIGLDCLLLMEKPAFISNFFAFPTQQPIIRTAAYRDIEMPLRVGADAAPSLDSFAGQIYDATWRERLSAPEYIWYLKGPGPLQLPSRIRPVVIRKRYAILQLLPGYRIHETIDDPYEAKRNPVRSSLFDLPKRRT